MNSRVLIITGASRGLGAAAARAAAELGANVTLASRSPDGLNAVLKEIEAGGRRGLAVRADVSRADDCREVIRQTVEAFGRIDGLINNSGMIEPIAPLAEADIDEWALNLSVNLLAPVRLIQLALPHLRQSRGRIVNVTSGAAVAVIGGWTAYSAAKAALNHLTRILAQEEPQVTTLALRPGIVDTAMQSAIRAKGKGRMAEANYRRLAGAYETGTLLPPDLPGRAMALLALYAPPEWSGEVLNWDDDRVKQLENI
ncbi:MAG: SDR family NAD(P)-dependent oxidoreductase [Chloroflexi bacterium]|nr:SDR family NAD(P)-dependent oxidoreductase [Chloroflexota bacterium]